MKAWQASAVLSVLLVAGIVVLQHPELFKNSSPPSQTMPYVLTGKLEVAGVITYTPGLYVYDLSIRNTNSSDYAYQPYLFLAYLNGTLYGDQMPLVLSGPGFFWDEVVLVQGPTITYVAIGGGTPQPVLYVSSITPFHS